MDEFALIKQITPSTYRRQELRKGIGDDAAVFRLQQQDTVVAVDTFVEHVHFTKETLTPFQIGYRLLAVNVSDMAAMGATPLFYLVSIVVPDELDERFVADVYSGMDALASTYKMDLIGGDTVSGTELTLSVTMIGSVLKEKTRLRSDAKDGDIVFVTGTLGDARAGLQLLLQKERIDRDDCLRQRLITKHQTPTPRVEFAQALQPLARVALNDVSDGIANELHEIAASSGVSIMIDDAAIPISDGLRLFSEAEQYEYKYFGGEDFELVGTVREADFPFVISIGEQLGLKITEIGSVSYNKERTGEVLIKRAGQINDLPKYGYVHKSRENND